jgi:hypothetical protein
MRRHRLLAKLAPHRLVPGGKKVLQRDDPLKEMRGPLAKLVSMAEKFVNIDRDTPMLLPPDMRDWIPEGHLVHFILDVVASLDGSRFSVNEELTHAACPR